MTEYLTRREALVAAIVAGVVGHAIPGSRLAHAAASANVGVIVPLSRPGDVEAGNNLLKSARLWAEWVNGQGGVQGQRVSLKVYDDKADPDLAAKAVARAVTNDHCAVILAGWDSAVALAEIEEAHRLKVPMFVAYAWSPEITRAGYPEVVRIGPNNDMLASAFAPFMAKQHYRRVAVLAEDTAFGQGLADEIRATASLAGIDVRARNYPRSTHDLRPALKQVLPAKPDAIVIAAAADPARFLGVTQARAFGYKGDILLGWDYVDGAFWTATGNRGVGAIWPTFSAPTLHLTTTGLAFKRLFTKKYNRAPLLYQALTWDQLSAWQWAADTAGSVAPDDVIRVLPRIDMQGSLGHITLSNKPGTIHFNQWEGVTVYFDQASKKGAVDATAKVIAAINQPQSTDKR